MATEEQREVEALAIRLLDSPELKKQKKICREFWRNHAVGKTPDAQATLDNHVDNIAFVHTLGAAGKRCHGIMVSPEERARDLAVRRNHFHRREGR